MPSRHPDELEPGMLLAADVTNLDGQTLFKEGLEITERHIEILLMWGVPTVQIVGDSENDPNSGEIEQAEAFSQAVLERAQSFTEEKFKLVRSSHPAIDVIKSIASHEAAKRFQQEQAR